MLSNTDAVRARETIWIHERRASLNEGYTHATDQRGETKEEQTIQNTNNEQLGLRECMLHMHVACAGATTKSSNARDAN